MNTRRSSLMLGVIGLLLGLPLLAGAQAPTKVYRVGYIQTATAEEQLQLTKAFEDALRALGYIEGKNVVFERRFADGRPERLPELATQLARLDVDVIVTGANPVIAAVRQATTRIPVVMATSRDPVGAGFVQSLARPGGNITGLAGDPTPEVQRKRLELLKEAVPRAARIAVLWNPLPPAAETYRKEVESAAGILGIHLWAVGVRARSEFEEAFAAMSREGADAIVVLPDPLFFTARRQVVDLAMKYRLPAIYHAREFVEIGGLISYGVSLADQFRRAAVYVDKILKGARPADLPIEQGTTFELVLNLNTAKTLGLSIAPALRLRADDVIE